MIFACRDWQICSQKQSNWDPIEHVQKFDISKFWGAFGEGFLDEFETFEEEPGWADVTLQDITAYLAKHPQRDCQSVEDWRRGL